MAFCKRQKYVLKQSKKQILTYKVSIQAKNRDSQAKWGHFVKICRNIGCIGFAKPDLVVWFEQQPRKAVC